MSGAPADRVSDLVPFVHVADVERSIGTVVAQSGGVSAQLLGTFFFVDFGMPTTGHAIL